MFGRPGGLGRRMEGRYPELRNRVGSAPDPGSSAGRPCYSGPRCFMGISLGLASVDGLPPPGWATWVDCALSVEHGGGKNGRENGWADGLTGGALCAGPEQPTKNLCRAAPRAGPGRFHYRVRELWSRRPFGRMFDGPGGSDPSPMFVAATVRLLLGRRRRSSTRRRARSSTRWPPSGWRDGGCWYTPRTRASRASPGGWTTSSPGTVPVGPRHARLTNLV